MIWFHETGNVQKGQFADTLGGKHLRSEGISSRRQCHCGKEANDLKTKINKVKHRNVYRYMNRLSPIQQRHRRMYMKF